MKNNKTLTQLIAALKNSPMVEGIFYTGSTVTSLRTSSDIDLVVILKGKTQGLRSIYTMLQGHFADIFFFNVQFVKSLQPKKTVPANSLVGIFVTWLQQGKIIFDPVRLLEKTKATLHKKRPQLVVNEQEKREWWLKMNYNRIANERYYRSSETEYAVALELRLLYSVTELMTTYFAFRDTPWRGEKAAFTHLATHDPRWYAAFVTFVQSTKVQKKMEAYRKLFTYTCTKKFRPWGKQFVIPVNQKGQYDKSRTRFWKAISGLL